MADNDKGCNFCFVCRPCLRQKVQPSPGGHFWNQILGPAEPAELFGLLWLSCRTVQNGLPSFKCKWQGFAIIPLYSVLEIPCAELTFAERLSLMLNIH